jgi:hypothetical protein
MGYNGPMIRFEVVAICDQCKKEVEGWIEQEIVGPLGFMGGFGNGPPSQKLTTKGVKPWIQDDSKIFCSEKCAADAKEKPQKTGI